MFNQDYYLNKQKQLASGRAFRLFWVWWGIYSVLIVFLAGVYLLTIHQAKIVLLALISFVLARIIISPLIFYFYRKQRPYQKLNFQPTSSWFLSPANKRFGSFPSDHAVSFASVATVIFWYSPALGIILAAVGLMNSWARVVLGFHYVIDIIGGWAIGIIAALSVIFWLGPWLFTPH